MEVVHRPNWREHKGRELGHPLPLARDGCVIGAEVQEIVWMAEGGERGKLICLKGFSFSLACERGRELSPGQGGGAGEKSVLR